MSGMFVYEEYGDLGVTGGVSLKRGTHGSTPGCGTVLCTALSIPGVWLCAVLFTVPIYMVFVGIALFTPPA